MALPAYIQHLKTRRENIAAELAAIDNNSQRSTPGSKPDVGGDGGGTQGTAYRMSLIDELRQLNKAIEEALQAEQAEDLLSNGPFEVEMIVE